MVASASSAITIDQKFYPQQYAFLIDQSRYPAFIGGRNSGKTFTGAYKALERASRGGLGLIAGPSFPAMKLGPKPRFLKVLDDAGLDYRENRNDNKLYIYSLNAEIQFAGLENDTYTRGPNYAWGWVDELDFVADPQQWKTAKAAVREGTDYQLFPTSTPKGRRLVYAEWVLHDDDFHTLHKATSFDNFFVDADDYVSGLGYTGTFYEQEINAEFVTFEGLVYPGFNRATCVRQQDCDGWRTVLGVDIGTRNPTAILTVRIAGDERQHIEREVYRANMSASEVVAAIESEADRCQPEAIYIDPTAAGYVKDVQSDGYPVEKADNDRKRGIQLCTSVVNHPNGFSVDPSCVNFIDELETYRYPDGRQGDDPLKEHDHAMDGWRYATVGSAEPGVEVDFF